MIFMIYGDGEWSASEMEVADTFLKKFSGLMLRKEAKKPMVFLKCKQVHTFFMKFDIDVYYFDNEMNIIDVQRKLKPWRVGRYVKDAYGIVEAMASDEPLFNIGDRLA